MSVRRTAIVTGASRGIGVAVARRLLADGFAVFAVARRPDSLSAIVASLSGVDSPIEAIAADVTRDEDRARIVETVLAKTGRIDVLVNNAGTIITSNPLDATEKDWDRLLNLNVKATYFMCQKVIPVMRAQGSGWIVNMASTAGRRPVPNHLIYGATKAAIISLTRSLAAACAKDRIAINALCPGLIATELTAETDAQIASLTGETVDQVSARRVAPIPAGRSGSPEDVAEVVSFLVSRGVSYLTGQAINVDGGVLMS